MAALPLPDKTTDGTISHLTNPAKEAGQVIGYSHSTKRANNARQVIGHNNIAALRESLSNDRLALEQNFLQHGKAASLLSAHSRLIDRYLHHVLSLIHISEPTRLGMISYAVFCLKKK